MPSKNCAKNLHSCQWERDIFFILFVLLGLMNIGQVVYLYRAKIYRVLRRGANQIPDEDDDPIIGIRD